MSELSRALADAGGVDAPRSLSAGLGRLLRSELERGAAELELTHTGYPEAIALALAPGEHELIAACPVAPELRADSDAASDRAGALVASAVAELAAAAGAGPPGELLLRLGRSHAHLALAYPSGSPRDAAELAALALEERFEATDRLRCRVLLMPFHALEPVEDLREPIGPTHPLRVAEALARLGGDPLDEGSLELHAEALARLLEPPGAFARAHEDPDPARRVARRVLQRLDGMGKWGGYHTEFVHLARGFEGNQRAHAYEVGEALLRAGLLVEKTSVGQRHVSLNPRRSGEIRRLIDEGSLPEALRLPLIRTSG